MSDVGFLPYRQLNYALKFEMLDEAMQVIDPPVVTAGQPVSVRVTAVDITGAAERIFSPDLDFADINPIDVSFQLAGQYAMMYHASGADKDKPLTSDKIEFDGETKQYSKVYDVYFTAADPAEVSLGAGYWCDRGCDDPAALRLSFMGDLVIAVRSGDPDENTSINSNDRVVPNAKPNNNAAVIPQAGKVKFEITAGPNPASRSEGSVKFFARSEQRFLQDYQDYQDLTATSKSLSGTLTVYDATGNVVRKIMIKDIRDGNDKNVIAEWDMRDDKGRPVSTGAYLLRGTIKTVDGKREKVSLIVSVR